MKKLNTVTSVVFALLCAFAVRAASIQEPATVFYGKVIGTGDAQPFMVHEGDLVWTIKNANGSNIVFKAELFPLNDGQFSYRLDIPHSAVAYELDSPDFGIPLPSVSQTNSHVSALIDGVPVEFIGPSGSAFTAGQVTRAQTYRLDMAININAVDSDGDGMPDWWEDLMGLDKQDPNDKYIDLDGDGVLSLAEYLNATNPNHDDRIPSLRTDELLVFPESVTGVRLLAVDVNSAADDLLFTLSEIPANGKLVLRNANENPENPDLELAAGAQFTQADVNRGRLVFVHDAADLVTDDTFSLTVSDGVSNTNVAGTIKLSFYEEPEEQLLMSTAQQQRQRAYTVAQRSDVVLWDAVRSFEDIAFAAPSSEMESAEYNNDYLLKFGDEQGQVMTGGRGDDTIKGGMADDILVGGIGVDTLTGGGGADNFIFDEGDNASDIITDFNPAEGDRINLAELLSERSGMVHDSIQFEIDGSDTLIGMNVKEDDTGFTSHVLRLSGVTVDSLAAYQLVLNDKVAVGRLRLQPCITIEATDSVASENGGNAGVFTLSRVGDLSKATDVNIMVSGSAQNGLDYSNIGSTVHFDAGQSTVTVQVSPFADGTVEGDEIVEVTVQDTDAYCLGSDVLARLTIKDLQSVVGVEVLQARASVSPMAPAVILVTRDGQTAASLFVRLAIGGKALNGTDYQYVNSFVDFAAGQTTVAISIVPTSYASLSGGAETVSIAVVENSNYALADVAEGTVVLVDSQETLSSWKTRVAPASEATISEFAHLPVENTGLDNLRCYAYGIDPQSPDSSLLPQINFRNGRLNVDVHQNPSAMDVQFVVESSIDLQSWSAGDIRTVAVPELADVAGMVTYEAVPAVGSNPKLFVRIRVIYND
ncbi:MAG: type I secretion C-terminal target domain-containing protein [Kiritimatiellae bacterium]|jgi:hypothetical protein|nr:type I secretion C-terminal target domain-containing protein [Kiritimatiellia bacterium]